MSTSRSRSSSRARRNESVTGHPTTARPWAPIWPPRAARGTAEEGHVEPFVRRQGQRGEPARRRAGRLRRVARPQGERRARAARRARGRPVVQAGARRAAAPAPRARRGARLLRFDAMARSLQEALAVLDRGAQLGVDARAGGRPSSRRSSTTCPRSRGARRRRARRTDGRRRTRRTTSPGAAARRRSSSSAARRSPMRSPRRRRCGRAAFECERTEDAQAALELARAYAPDVVLVDADVPQARGARRGAARRSADRAGAHRRRRARFRAPDEAARFVALGVAQGARQAGHARGPPPRVRRDPRRARGPHDARHARRADARAARRAPLGGAEARPRRQRRPRRALVPRPARRGDRGARRALGRHRARAGDRLAEDRGRGALRRRRARGRHRAGAVAAPRRAGAPSASAGRGRGAAADVRLHGRRVVVADDDPGVTWFISDLLRTAGCEVHEALDGTTALDLAFRVQPELVVSDILMPGLDGFALSPRAAPRRRAARRAGHPALVEGGPAAARARARRERRRVHAQGERLARHPRARPRGAPAAGAHRGAPARRRRGARPARRADRRGCCSSSSARSARTRASPCATRRSSTRLRSAAARPRKATRTASDGGYQSGERALASLLGVGAGRFVVSPSQRADPRRARRERSFDQLARPVAAARGALAATTGARTMNVERVAARRRRRSRSTCARRRSRRARSSGGSRSGASPRQMLLGGEVAPTLLEDVLADLAARGAIRGVEGAGGADLLTPAVDAALAVLRGAPKASVVPAAERAAERRCPLRRGRAPARPAAGARVKPSQRAAARAAGGRVRVARAERARRRRARAGAADRAVRRRRSRTR